MGYNNSMMLLGDVHAKFDRLPKTGNIVQVGDFGVGFGEVPPLSPTFRFIRGNHDNPELCRTLPNYLGDYGYTEDGIFFAGGAYSVDQKARMPYVTWFPDEELSYTQMDAAIDLYRGADLVISHDCPQTIAKEHLGVERPSNTRRFLEAIWAIKAPKVWVFGHHHTSMRVQRGETLFICLNELETLEL